MHFLDLAFGFAARGPRFFADGWGDRALCDTMDPVALDIPGAELMASERGYAWVRGAGKFVLLLGLLVCGAAYVAMTCTYLYAAPASELANGKKSPIDLVGSALFGTWGGTLVFLLISVSVIG